MPSALFLGYVALWVIWYFFGPALTFIANGVGNILGGFHSMVLQSLSTISMVGPLEVMGFVFAVFQGTFNLCGPIWGILFIALNIWLVCLLFVLKSKLLGWIGIGAFVYGWLGLMSPDMLTFVWNAMLFINQLTFAFLKFVIDGWTLVLSGL